MSTAPPTPRPHQKSSSARRRRLLPPWALPVGVFVLLTLLLVLRILSVSIPVWLWWTVAAVVGVLFVAGAIEWIVLRRKPHHGHH